MSQHSEERARGRRVAGLVRHGHFNRPENTASAHRLLALSEKGREQARDCAGPILEFCDQEGLELDSTIEVSQLLRAWETGMILADALAKRTSAEFEIEVRDEIIERGLGSCANLRFDEIARVLSLDPRLDPLPDDWRRTPNFRLPVQGAESLMQAGARTGDRIASSVASIPGDDPRDLLRLFVAHSGCLRHAAVHLGVVELEEVSGLSMDFCQAILIEKLPGGKWVQVAGIWKKHLLPSGAAR